MKHTLAKNAVYNVIYRILNVIFPLITATYVSRILEPAGIGQVAYAQNISSYFLMFAALGIPAYGTREIAKYQENPKARSKLFSELLTINFLSTAISLAGYLILVQALFPDSSLIYLVFALDLAFNFINIDWLFQGQEDYGYITVRSLLVKIISLLCLFLLVKDRQDYIQYGLIVCLGTGCNYVFNVFHARAYAKLTFRRLDLKQHIKPLMFLLISSATASLYSKVDTTMLGWISSSEAVGYYANAHKIVNIVLTLVTAVSAVFLPRLSYVFNNDREKYGSLLTSGLKIVLILALPCCAGLFLVADELVPVFFGDLFIPAVRTLKILSILIIIKGVGDLLCYQAIISTGNEKHLIKSRVLASAANILLNSLLIPRYAQDGAAIASVVSEVIVNGVMLVYSLSIAKPKLDKAFLTSIIGATAVMAMVVILIESQIAGNLASLLMSAIIGALVYFGIALLMKNDMLMNVIYKLRDRQRPKSH